MKWSNLNTKKLKKYPFNEEKCFVGLTPGPFKLQNFGLLKKIWLTLNINFELQTYHVDNFPFFQCSLIFKLHSKKRMIVKLVSLLFLVSYTSAVPAYNRKFFHSLIFFEVVSFKKLCDTFCDVFIPRVAFFCFKSLIFKLLLLGLLNESEITVFRSLILLFTKTFHCPKHSQQFFKICDTESTPPS